MKIGVFDSGIGGLSVANAIARAMPELTILFRHDSADHFPYATKSPDIIYGFVVPILEDMVGEGCDVIVVACNTVTTTLIDRLRQRFSLPLIGVEPMVQAAAERTKTGLITVCATPTTLASARYQELKRLYASDMTIIEPDCSDWSRLIEHNEMTEAKIREDIIPSLAIGSDVIVLGCTHYHWIEDEIRQIVDEKAVVVQPEQMVIDELRQVLARLA